MCIVKLLNKRIDRYFRPMDSNLLLWSNPMTACVKRGSLLSFSRSFYHVSACGPDRIGTGLRLSTPSADALGS